MADMRRNPQARDSELTGRIYRAITPRKQVTTRPSRARDTITLKGPHLPAVLNQKLGVT